MKTLDFLLEIIRRHHLTTRTGETGTAYSLWKYMNEKYGWTKASVSHYFAGKGFPGEEQALQIAEELELNSGYVLACIEADRAKNPDVKAAWEAAAEQLQKAPAKKAATRRSSSKSAKVASVILSLGIVTGVLAPGMKALQAPDIAKNYELTDYSISEGRIEPMCIMSNCGSASAPLLFGISLLFLLSVVSLRLALDRSPALTHANNKKNYYKRLNHGRDLARLPDPRRIITSRGGNVVRLFPSNLPAPRGQQHTAGRPAAVIEIQSRRDRHLAGLPIPRGSDHHTGRHATASQSTGELSLCANAAGRTDRGTSSENRGTRGGYPDESAQTIPVHNAGAITAYSNRDYIPAARSASSTPAPGAPHKRSAAIGRAGSAGDRAIGDQSTARRESRIFRTAWAATWIICLIGSLLGQAHAAGGISLSLVSEHHGTELQYNEINPGLCLESGFNLTVIGCVYRDSQAKPAGVMLAAARISITPWLHLGGGFGLRIKQSINEDGQAFTDPDPAAAALLDIGTIRHALQIAYTPKIELKDSTIPAVTALQYRYGFQ